MNTDKIKKETGKDKKKTHNSHGKDCATDFNEDEHYKKGN